MPIDYLPIETVMFRIDVKFPEGLLYSFQLLDQICTGATSTPGRRKRRGGLTWLPPFFQWEFQDLKLEVLYHIRPYFRGIFPYIGLKNRPYIW
jgi:hypothetical protein